MIEDEPFDIAQHEFSGDITSASSISNFNDELMVTFLFSHNTYEETCISKEDVIAMAKAYGVTESDLLS